MSTNMSRIGVVFLSIPLVLLTIGFGVNAQAQESCGLGQDELVSLVKGELFPASNSLTASPQQLAAASNSIAVGSPECALDVVVAVGTIRPDAAVVVSQNVAARVPGQEQQILAAGDQLGQSPPTPASGFQGSTIEDSDDRYPWDDDDDGFDDDDDDGASPT